MAAKTRFLYKEIFDKIYDYLSIIFDNTTIEIKSFTKVFEEGLINRFLLSFKNKINVGNGYFTFDKKNS